MIPSFPLKYIPFSFTWLPISHAHYKGHSAAALDLRALELAANEVPALPSRSVKLGRTSVRTCQHGEQECWRGVIINNTPPIPTLSAIPPTIAPPLTLPLSWCWACPIQRCQNTTNYNLKREYLVGENMKHNQPLCQKVQTTTAPKAQPWKLLWGSVSCSRALQKVVWPGRESKYHWSKHTWASPCECSAIHRPSTHSSTASHMNQKGWTCKAVSTLRNSLQTCLHKIPAMEEVNKKVYKGKCYLANWSLYSSIKINNFQQRFNPLWQMLSAGHAGHVDLSVFRSRLTRFSKLYKVCST